MQSKREVNTYLTETNGRLNERSSSTYKQALAGGATKSVDQQLPQDHRRVRNNARTRLAHHVPSPDTPFLASFIIDLQNQM